MPYPLAFPLKHTDVKAKISGNISRVEVTQTFENPFTTPLEATYVFPLPDEAAVDTMTIRLGDRTIQGRIEKREEAQAIYEQAKQEGRTAGLLEQERANIFTQSLANIRPGEQIEVVITYSDSLPYKQGSYEFIFPMVVGPRYIPGHPIEATGLDHGSAPAPMTINQDTDQVSDASRLNGPILPVGTRSGHDIQVTVDIDMGQGGEGSGVERNELGIRLSNLHSPSHQIRVDTSDGLTRITLAPNDTLPNKDLIVRYQVAGAETQTTVLTQADQRGGHFAIYLIPAIAYDPQQYIPKDMVFLIDTSGSQSGRPLAQCQTLMRRFIDGLHPQDTFNVVNFANTAQQLSKMPLDNTPKNRQRALNYVNSLRAGGGTEMLRGLKTVLNLPQLASDRIRNIVLLTDGYIGNETQIFAEVQRSLSPSTRLHSFGAGSSVNRFLLNRVAEFGRGISQIVRHDQPIDQVVDTFFGQINNPVLGNLSLCWEGKGAAPELYPMAPLDLFAEQPLVLFGRKGDRQSGVLHLTGITGNRVPFEQSLTIAFDAGTETPRETSGEMSGNKAIAQLWGRARIKELMNQMVNGETIQGVEAVTQIALNYQLLTQYTAFVAVSDQVRVEQVNERVSINVPTNMPEGVSYEGVFGALASVPTRASIASAHSFRAYGQGTMQPMPLADPTLSAASSPSMFSRTDYEPPEEDDMDNSDALLSSPLPQSPSIGRQAAPRSRSAEAKSRASKKGVSPSGKSPSPLRRIGNLFKRNTPLAPPSGPRPNQLSNQSSNQSSNQPSGQLIILHILEAKGLQNMTHQHLKQYLQMLRLDGPDAGMCVFDLVLKNGRVKRVMLDIEASDALDPGVIYQLRQALLTWSCPQSTLTSLRLKLQIKA
ncbi:MAG: VIT domain-containing protein [Cyanobacteria bacterium P01_F01_bin.150]